MLYCQNRLLPARKLLTPAAAERAPCCGRSFPAAVRLVLLGPEQAPPLVPVGSVDGGVGVRVGCEQMWEPAIQAVLSSGLVGTLIVVVIVLGLSRFSYTRPEPGTRGGAAANRHGPRRSLPAPSHSRRPIGRPGHVRPRVEPWLRRGQARAGRRLVIILLLSSSRSGTTQCPRLGDRGRVAYNGSNARSLPAFKGASQSIGASH